MAQVKRKVIMNLLNLTLIDLKINVINLKSKIL